MRILKLSKEGLSMSQLQTVQNFIIVCLTSGLFIPPRRSIDWTLMKHSNFNKDKDNYYDKKQFVFNQYKTAKYYKQQSIDVPTSLKTMNKN